MPWTNQGGNGGGPWKPSNPGPWGQGPGGGRPPSSPPPDLEDALRRAQEKLRGFLPGGDVGSLGVLALALLVGIVWLGSGFYTVAPNEVGLNLVFGRYTGKTASGLNYNWPYPVGNVIKLPVTDRNATDIGSTSREDTRRGTTVTSDAPEESLMLTGDENIADVKFRVIWQIDPAQPENYAFRLANPPEVVRAVAESAMREVIGRSQLQRILTSDRSKIEQSAQELTQGVLTGYKAGVLILQTQLLSVGPPSPVVAAYRDVTAAQQDLQRQRNEAESYANRVVPEARGAAARILQEADAYREQVVQEAQGQASRFDQIYAQYRNAPAVTRERIYLETMEKVLSGTDKVIVDTKNGVLPYLPLGTLAPAAVAPAAPAATRGAAQ